MFQIHNTIGIDANQPIFGVALSDTVADPKVIASTGAGWVRLNFVLEAASSPDDAAWLNSYHRVIDQFTSEGLKIYGLISAQAVKTDVDHRLLMIFRQPEGATPEQDRIAAYSWIQQYATNFGTLVATFHPKVAFFESINEPNDWRGGSNSWIDPSWFARTLQTVYNKVKGELGFVHVNLISGPLLGHFHHQPTGESAARYLEETYRAGETELQWGHGQPYPFDGVGYHLYLKPDFDADCARHQREVARYYANFTGRMLDVMRTHEGITSKKQLFISEMGWTSSEYDDPHFKFQSENVKMALNLMAQDQRVGLGFWFCTKDFQDGLGNQFYGLYRLDKPIATAHKPAFYTYKAFCDQRFGEESPLRFSNQTIINAIFAAAAECSEDGWTWVVRAGLQHLAESQYMRNAPYVGPAVELLPGLDAHALLLIKSKLREQVATPLAARSPLVGVMTPQGAAQDLLLWGKGMYIWQIPACEGGAAAAIAARAVAAGLTHVLIKVADGAMPSNISKTQGDLAGPVAMALRNRGIQVWGWQFVYGKHPSLEIQPQAQAAMAIQRVRQFDLDGFVVDAEGSFEGQSAKAACYMSTLRATLPTLPIALSSFRFVTGHQNFPWEEFLEQCDLHMPQVYWQKQDPVVTLQKSFEQHRQHRYARPIVPTGAAYFMEAGVPATPEQITAFLTAAKQNSYISGANFWSWQHADQPRWQAITEFEWS